MGRTLSRFVGSLALTMVLGTARSQAQTAADSAAIRATALDYVEGWYNGDSVRMARAVHPDLVKRIVNTDANGTSRLDQMGAARLITGAARGYGKETPPERQQKDVAIYDIFHNVALVRATMTDWIDYMQMARFNGRWVIINVLWEMKPKG
jgi:hypothetical protein